MKKPITVDEIIQVQMDWGKSLIEIGNIFRHKENYTEATINHIEKFYAYDIDKVLFKPTQASLHQFRLTKESAVSYFIGGNPDFPRDTGFALLPWTSVRFENAGFILKDCYALAMGNYYFSTPDGKELKVEYTFGYCRYGEKLKLNLHHSSLPFEL